jgi:glycosyltransferase involved in cell wall biosynthesis
MTTPPRLTIGLPVYNGEEYLAQSLNSVLEQTYSDFELVLSSNASTDATDDICRDYQRRDSRIRFVRQRRNLGCAGNDNFCFAQSRTELFKWASADDLWDPDLVRRCIDLLDASPNAILAHSWTAAIDGSDNLIQAFEYPLVTDSPSAPERFRSMLFDNDGMPGAIRSDDFYGVIRADVLRRVKPHNSYYHADQVFMSELALHGPFVQIPEWLYFRRHHPGRALLANPTVRSWCANLEPRRANRLLHPTPRLVAEFPLDYAAAVTRAPLNATDRRQCFAHLARWGFDRVQTRLRRNQSVHQSLPLQPDPATLAKVVVPGS